MTKLDTKKIRVLIADDEKIVRDGIVAILASQNDIEVIGEAQDGFEVVDLAEKYHPDIILLDTYMPRQDGLTTIPILQERTPKSHILMLSSFVESNTAYQAIKSGALGFLLKDVTRSQFLQAIREVAVGHSFLDPAIAVKLINEFKHPEEDVFTKDLLTPRETDIMRMLAQGMSNQEIADALFVNHRTVTKYLSNILSKLELTNRTQATLFAIQEGFSASSFTSGSSAAISLKLIEQQAEIFISYARADIDVVQEIHKALIIKKHHPWMDIYSIKAGENWLQAICKAIDECQIFLAILSNNSISRRGVIQKELKKAMDKWEGMLPDDIYIIPIRIDDCPIPDLLKHIQVLDWGNGKGENKLLEAIRIGLARRKSNG